MNTNLVIVRAGKSSRHPDWLSSAGNNRNWDLVLSTFGGASYHSEANDVIDIPVEGPKWDALHRLLMSSTLNWKEYNYIWLPDDDLACDGQEISRFFDICAKYRLLLAQPSLQLGSFISHPITGHDKRYFLRYTNWVELMAPMFDRQFLERCVDSFGGTISGWGLDYLWPQFLQNEANRIAIVDAVQIVHTRPFGGPNYNLLREAGISPTEEMRRLLKRLNIERYLLSSSGGIRADGPMDEIELRIYSPEKDNLCGLW